MIEEHTTDPAFDEIAAAQPAPPTDVVIGKSREARAAEWQAKTDAVVEEALLGVPNTIAGVQLKPFSTARGSLLRKIGNEFVQGVRLQDIADPFLSIGKFLTIMSSELPEARRLVAAPDDLEEKAYELLDTVPMRDVRAVVNEINAYVHREIGNQVHGTVPDNGETKAPEGPKN